MVTARKSRLSKILQTPGPGPRIIAPTTTRKIAQRMVSASRLVAAAKHGALSNDGGALLVAWSVEQDAHSSRTLSVEWQESGLVPASRRDGPAREGYGRELIERALRYQLGAETSYALGDTELRCTIRVPIVSGSTGLGEE